ncbi:divergent polysaccharide deacetylase family protein [Haloimpatiens sp. FM7330]|uniref:divergent polysaccharide deacetylase family protein n=1 Tax=Haloimpatiens sp. FM7330 TaxID=3298610 RepID=UPI003632D64E
MIILIRKKSLYKIVIAVLVMILIGFMIYIVKNVRCIEDNPADEVYVAIVVDDFGNSGDGTKEMLNMDIPLTAAVMPFLENSEKDAKDAHDKGLEIILHMPMEPKHGKKSWLGPKGITTNLSSEEIKSRVTQGLEQIKYAKGMNNHMGSKAMQDERVVKNLLKVAKEKHIYFLDSKTTSKCRAEEICNSLGVNYYTRDIFLDNSKRKVDIEKQLDKLTEIALKKGYAIAIGHVGEHGGTVTARAIKNKYKSMEKKGIKFVYLSDLRNIILNSHK